MVKICSSCKKEKDFSEFYVDSKHKTGRSSRCKLCAKYFSKKWYEESDKYREIIRNSGLKHRFGITNEDYFEMLKDQNGVCCICKQPPEEGKYFHVDHCHVSSDVKGLLCKNCNHGLGNFKDNPSYLRNAIEYLDRNSASK